MKNRPIYNSLRFKLSLILNRLGLYDFFHRAYFKLFEEKGADRRLILVIGVGRCGSTWISDTLSRSDDIDVFLEEPLYKLSFPIILNDLSYYEHTAVNPKSNVEYLERLERCFESFLYASQPRSLFNAHLVDKCLRKNSGKKVTLVKEVHSLFGYEKVISKTNTKCIYIKRELIEHLDSLVDYIPRNSDLLKLEYDSLKDLSISSSIYKGQVNDFNKMINEIESMPTYNSNLLKKIVVINSINRHYANIAKESNNVRIVSYNEIIKDRDVQFGSICDFIDISYEPGSYVLNDRKHTIRTDEELINRKFKSLSKDDVIFLTAFLSEWNDIFDLK